MGAFHALASARWEAHAPGGEGGRERRVLKLWWMVAEGGAGVELSTFMVSHP